jgi:uncharacterized membrane protein
MWVYILLLIIIDLPWIFFTSGWSTAVIRGVQLIPIKIRWIPVFLVYVAAAYVLTYASSALQAFLLGLSMYALYEMTNLATFERWDWRFSIADSLWGGTLFATTYSIVWFLSPAKNLT